MSVNKVVLGNVTLLDLTNDTVSPSSLLQGFTATDASGTSITGTVVVPTKTSDLINDSGFITGYTETDPTVPSWAKAANKPSYTASEVGAQPTLVSGTNIKTINNESLLGSGNITISANPTAMTDSEIIAAVESGWGVTLPQSASGVSF